MNQTFGVILLPFSEESHYGKDFCLE